MLQVTAKTLPELTAMIDKMDGFISATIKKEDGVWVAHVEGATDKRVEMCLNLALSTELVADSLMQLGEPEQSRELSLQAKFLRDWVASL